MIIKIVDGYKSKYKGTEVDKAVAKALTAVSSGEDNIFTGFNTFKGVVEFNNIARAVSPGLSDSSRSIATTSWVKRQNYLTGITAEMITEALGYVPENISNKVIALTAESTDDQYPSAKCVYTITTELKNEINTNTLDIAINTADIETNASNIATNTTDIETNRNSIATNAANIETNRVNIATNASNIATNTADIETNKTNIATNTANIETNRVNIANNATSIATNTSNIAVNTANIATNTSDINTINEKIPSTATSSNQLVDKAFVNSSIATNTSYFIGTFNSVAELKGYSGTLTNNDYGFVISEDTAGNTLYNRYKYNSSLGQWLFEYALNNSSFTADEWAAISSGANTTNIGQIATNTANIATNASNIATNTTNIATNASNISNLETNKQDNILDLQTIREGAAAGATALQPGGNISELVNNTGYITGITSSDVTTALGFTPYNATNPDGFITKFNVTNPTLPSQSGVCTWNIVNSKGSKTVHARVYEVATGEEIVTSIVVSDSTVIVKFISTDDIPAGSFEAVIVG